MTATRIGLNTMLVSWIPLNLVEARGFVREYIIAYKRTGGQKRQVEMSVVVNGNLTNATIDGLSSMSSYSVTVAARTGGGMGEFSQAATVPIPGE